MDWKRVIRDCHEKSSFRTEWVRLGEGSLFLLAWKGTEVRVIFVDLAGDLAALGPTEVKEEFLVLLSHLRRGPQWEKIFKGREVSFKWLTLVRASEAEGKTLELAGVEPYGFLDYWENKEG